MRNQPDLQGLLKSAKTSHSSLQIQETIEYSTKPLRSGTWTSALWFQLSVSRTPLWLLTIPECLFPNHDFSEDPLTRKEIEQIFSVIFPTHHQLSCSEFLFSANCLFFSKSNYEKDSFLTNCVKFPQANDHQGFSHFQGIVPHFKILVVVPAKNSAESPRDLSDSLVYYGSHNLSVAAWGKQRFPPKTKNTKPKQ